MADLFGQGVMAEVIDKGKPACFRCVVCQVEGGIDAKRIQKKYGSDATLVVSIIESWDDFAAKHKLSQPSRKSSDSIATISHRLSQ